VACTRIEEAEGNRALNRIELARPRDGQANGDTLLFDSPQVHEDGVILQHATFNRGGVDLIQAQVITQHCSRLGKLAT